MAIFSVTEKMKKKRERISFTLDFVNKRKVLSSSLTLYELNYIHSVDFCVFNSSAIFFHHLSMVNNKKKDTKTSKTESVIKYQTK